MCRRYYVSQEKRVYCGCVTATMANAALKWWTHKIYDRLNKKFNSINIKFIYFIWSSDSAAYRSLNRTSRPDTFFFFFHFSVSASGVTVSMNFYCGNLQSPGSHFIKCEITSLCETKSTIFAKSCDGIFMGSGLNIKGGVFVCACFMEQSPGTHVCAQVV